VTSATHRLALSRLRAGGIPTPQRRVTADQVANGKPFPDPYLAGAKLLGLPPSDCLVIEDAPSGATAGHAAGCRVLATTFSHPIDTLSAADWIVRSLDDVQVSVTPDHIEVEFDPLPRE
jgi:sugar-phosphatase